MTAESPALFQRQVRALASLRALAESSDLWLADRAAVTKILVDFTDVATEAFLECRRQAEMTSRYNEERRAAIEALAAATQRLRDERARLDEERVKDFELMEFAARRMGVLPAGPTLPN